MSSPPPSTNPTADPGSDTTPEPPCPRCGTTTVRVEKCWYCNGPATPPTDVGTARANLDLALAQAQPHAGYPVSSLIQQLQRALTDTDTYNTRAADSPYPSPFNELGRRKDTP